MTFKFNIIGPIKIVYYYWFETMFFLLKKILNISIILSVISLIILSSDCFFFYFQFSRFLLNSIQIVDMVKYNKILVIKYWLKIIIDCACFKRLIILILALPIVFCKRKNIFFKKFLFWQI